MQFTAEDTKKEFELCPEVITIGRCYQIVDLGTHETNWGPKRQVRIAWELPKVLMKDSKPFSISQKYTQAFYENSNLRKLVNSWLPKPISEADFLKNGFNIEQMLGMPCRIKVVHAEAKDGSGKKFANLGVIMALEEEIICPDPFNDYVYFDLGNYDDDVYQALPQYLKDIISKSPEFKEIQGRMADEKLDFAANGDVTEDDIPF